MHRADAIRVLADHLEFDPSVFLQLFEARAHKTRESEVNARSGFAKYMEGIDKVIHALDAL
jgi:hypothetical protein